MPCTNLAGEKGGPKTAKMETDYMCACGQCDCDNKVSKKGAVCDECKD
jgi:hypothetical protein